MGAEHTLFPDLLVCETDDAVHFRQIMNAVCYEDSGGPAFCENSLRSENMFEQVLPDVNVDSRQRVVHNVELSVTIDGACDRHSLLLPTRQVDSTFSDFSRVAARQNLEVRHKSARLQRVLVAFLVELRAEKDVLFQRCVLHPRCLCNVRHLFGL